MQLAPNNEEISNEFRTYRREQQCYGTSYYVYRMSNILLPRRLCALNFSYIVVKLPHEVLMRVSARCRIPLLRPRPHCSTHRPTTTLHYHLCRRFKNRSSVTNIKFVCVFRHRTSAPLTVITAVRYDVTVPPPPGQVRNLILHRTRSYNVLVEMLI
jgi:hypothetical protein